MSTKGFFSRNKAKDALSSVAKVLHPESKITCDTEDLKSLITKWTANEGFKYENFADFMELIGVKTPARLSQYDDNTDSFKCVSALGTEAHISLFFGDWLDYPSLINITVGEETRCYEVNSCMVKGNNVPKVTLSSRKIRQDDDKKIENYYCNYFCSRTLKFDDTHSLTVSIDEPNKFDIKPEIYVLRNCKEVEEYLLGLDKDLLNVSEVYTKVMELLDFSEDEISKSEGICVSYTEISDNEEVVRAKVLKRNGKMQEYAILEDGETFHVYGNGDWEYVSDDGVKISYRKKNKQFAFSITANGSEESITNLNPDKIMKHVKNKITELMKFAFKE